MPFVCSKSLLAAANPPAVAQNPKSISEIPPTTIDKATFAFKQSKCEIGKRMGKKKTIEHL